MVKPQVTIVAAFDAERIAKDCRLNKKQTKDFAEFVHKFNSSMHDFCYIQNEDRAYGPFDLVSWNGCGEIEGSAEVVLFVDAGLGVTSYGERIEGELDDWMAKQFLAGQRLEWPATHTACALIDLCQPAIIAELQRQVEVARLRLRLRLSKAV